MASVPRASPGGSDLGTVALAEAVSDFQRRFPPRSEREDPDAERRARIMAVTLETAAAHGVKGATLRTIAARTGMRTASLYSYFPGGKDELVSTALGEGLGGFYREAAAVLRADEGALENLRRLVFAHTRWTLSNPTIAPAILVLERAHLISPLMDEATARSIRQLHRDYRRLLSAILAGLDIHDADAARLAELLIVVCDNADLWAPAGVGGRDVSDAQEAAWLAARRLAGLC
jgi:AcrR family transcriptional regulator